jgi:hypothetical protein
MISVTRPFHALDQEGNASRRERRSANLCQVLPNSSGWVSIQGSMVSATNFDTGLELLNSHEHNNQLLLTGLLTCLSKKTPRTPLRHWSGLGVPSLPRWCALMVTTTLQWHCTLRLKTKNAFFELDELDPRVLWVFLMGWIEMLRCNQAWLSKFAGWAPHHQVAAACRTGWPGFELARWISVLHGASRIEVESGVLKISQVPGCVWWFLMLVW